jgi:hypothetical protein
MERGSIKFGDANGEKVFSVIDVAIPASIGRRMALRIVRTGW